MSGSRKWFSYTTDAGDPFVYQADESNAELAGTGVDLGGGASLLYPLPRGIEPRHAVYKDATRTITRKALISLITGVPTTPIVDPVSGASLELVAIVSEKRRFASGVDTGIIDGDAS